MTTSNMRQVAATAVALMLISMAWPKTGAAHCDSMDGPVVKAAQAALAGGSVTPVLMWVRAEDEQEIRQAFDRTMRVRRLGADAREMADRWFFETLVRVHREGEGEPYTGLKPAGQEPAPGIALADRSLSTGNAAALSKAVADDVAKTIREKHERVMALSRYAPEDVAAGRRYVHAYVEYIHFVEGLHGALHGETGAARH